MKRFSQFAKFFTSGLIERSFLVAMMACMVSMPNFAVAMLKKKAQEDKMLRLNVDKTKDNARIYTALISDKVPEFSADGNDPQTRIAFTDFQLRVEEAVYNYVSSHPGATARLVIHTELPPTPLRLSRDEINDVSDDKIKTNLLDRRDILLDVADLGSNRAEVVCMFRAKPESIKGYDEFIELTQDHGIISMPVGDLYSNLGSGATYVVRNEDKMVVFVIRANQLGSSAQPRWTVSLSANESLAREIEGIRIK